MYFFNYLCTSYNNVVVWQKKQHPSGKPHHGHETFSPIDYPSTPSSPVKPTSPPTSIPPSPTAPSRPQSPAVEPKPEPVPEEPILLPEVPDDEKDWGFEELDPKAEKEAEDYVEKYKASLKTSKTEDKKKDKKEDEKENNINVQMTGIPCAGGLGRKYRV